MTIILVALSTYVCTNANTEKKRYLEDILKNIIVIFLSFILNEDIRYQLNLRNRDEDERILKVLFVLQKTRKNVKVSVVRRNFLIFLSSETMLKMDGSITRFELRESRAQNKELIQHIHQQRDQISELSKKLHNAEHSATSIKNHLKYEQESMKLARQKLTVEKKNNLILAQNFNNKMNILIDVQYRHQRSEIKNTELSEELSLERVKSTTYSEQLNQRNESNIQDNAVTFEKVSHVINLLSTEKDNDQKQNLTVGEEIDQSKKLQILLDELSVKILAGRRKSSMDRKDFTKLTISFQEEDESLQSTIKKFRDERSLDFSEDLFSDGICPLTRSFGPSTDSDDFAIESPLSPCVNNKYQNFVKRSQSPQQTMIDKEILSNSNEMSSSYEVSPYNRFEEPKILQWLSYDTDRELVDRESAEPNTDRESAEHGINGESAEFDSISVGSEVILNSSVAADNESGIVSISDDVVVDNNDIAFISDNVAVSNENTILSVSDDVVVGNENAIASVSDEVTPTKSDTFLAVDEVESKTDTFLGIKEGGSTDLIHPDELEFFSGEIDTDKEDGADFLSTSESNMLHLLKPLDTDHIDGYAETDSPTSVAENTIIQLLKRHNTDDTSECSDLDNSFYEKRNVENDSPSSVTSSDMRIKFRSGKFDSHWIKKMYAKINHFEELKSSMMSEETPTSLLSPTSPMTPMSPIEPSVKVLVHQIEQQAIKKIKSPSHSPSKMSNRSPRRPISTPSPIKTLINLFKSKGEKMCCLYILSIYIYMLSIYIYMLSTYTGY